MSATVKLSNIFEQNKSVDLDLGCGENKQPGFIGIDQRALPDVDIVWDLINDPWTCIPPEIVKNVVMSHFFEHVIPWRVIHFMAELHRVCKVGAKIFISGPYAMGFRYIQDPTHCNPVNEATFLYWDKSHDLWNVYKPPPFKLESFDIIPVGNDRDFNALLIKEDL